MTTIAFKDDMMVCDSCWSCDDAIDSLMTKITRLSSGALIGQAGDNDARAIERLLDKVKSPAGLPLRDELLKIRLSYMGLLVFPRGRIFKVGLTNLPESNWGDDFDQEVGIWEISTPFAAIGTGKEFAMGAMAAGKSAAESVRIACRYDINSRLPIHVVALAKKTKPA